MNREPRHRRRGWPIAAVMSLELLVAALVPMSIGVWLATARSGEALASEARTSLALLATVTAAQIDQLLRGASHALVQVADDDRVVDLLQRRSDDGSIDVGAIRAAVERRLQLAARSSADFAFVMVLDTTGSVVATTDPTTVGQNYATRGYWRGAMAGEHHISEMIRGRTTGLPGVFISAPVRSSDRIVGVAVLKIDGDRVRDIVVAASPGGAGQAILSSRNGVILAHADPTLHFRSLGPLSADVAQSIDAVNDYGVDRIDPAPLASLGVALRVPLAGADEAVIADGNEITHWVVGHAPLATRPWSLGVMVPRAQFVAPLREVIREQLVILLAIAALAAAYAVLRARGIVRPLVALTAAAERVADGDFDAQTGIRRGDELGTLARAFDGMVPRLREHVELRQSLAVAMDVQQALLPSGDPDVAGLEIAGRSRYCDATGGDYYDYVSLLPGRTMIVIGDVMGHGVASALLMATARAALRAHAALRSDLGDLMTQVNRVLAADARHGRFMTMAMVVVDTNDRTIRWASAGHDPIMVFDPSIGSATSGVRELDEGELPLGVDASQVYHEHAATLPADAVLLVGTDGIWETAGPDGTMYGKERLFDTINAAVARSERADGIATAIETDLSAFRGTARILDDITFVVARLTTEVATEATTAAMTTATAASPADHAVREEDRR